MIANTDRILIQGEMKKIQKELAEMKLFMNIEIQTLKQILNEIQRRPIISQALQE